jgi:putative oxidoreductase
MKSTVRVAASPRTVRIKNMLLVEIVSALFILLFVYTGINKLLSIDSLQKVLKDYPLLSGMPILVSWVLPITELVVAALLFIRKTKLLGLYSSWILMSGFTLYLLYMFAFAKDMPCTCGGMLQKLTWNQHLIFNIFFILLATIAIVAYKREKSRIE